MAGWRTISEKTTNHTQLMEATAPQQREITSEDLSFLAQYSAFLGKSQAVPADDLEERLRQHVLHLWHTCLAEVPPPF